ncbi:hypothetical protein BH23BAC4_BH23BAC4_10500 [soil metagenome]
MAVILNPGRTQAQMEDPVTWTAEISPSTVLPGESPRLLLNATIDGVWRLYAMDSPVGRPLRVVTTDTRTVRFGEARQAEPRSGYDTVFESDFSFFSERATVTVPLEVRESATPGPAGIEASVTYMVCNERLCLPPVTRVLAATLVVQTPAAAEPQRSQSLRPEASADPIAQGHVPPADDETPLPEVDPPDAPRDAEVVVDESAAEDQPGSGWILLVVAALIVIAVIVIRRGRRSATP